MAHNPFHRSRRNLFSGATKKRRILVLGILFQGSCVFNKLLHPFQGPYFSMPSTRTRVFFVFPGKGVRREWR